MRALKKTRPQVQRNRHYGCCYLVGAACSARGEAASHVAAKAYTEFMNERPAVVGATVA